MAAPYPYRLLAASGLAFLLGLALAFAGHALLRPPHRPIAARPDLAAVARAEVIAKDDLPDAAVAVFDTRKPKIYLNTRMMARIGPELAAFLRAHEEGHIAYHHVPERRFGLVRVETPAPVLHQYEFAADCHAAQTLRGPRPDAVRAAIRFFQLRRDVVTDAAHPAMGARAAQLIDCLTDPARSLRSAH